MTNPVTSDYHERAKAKRHAFYVDGSLASETSDYNQALYTWELMRRDYPKAWLSWRVYDGNQSTPVTIEA